MSHSASLEERVALLRPLAPFRALGDPELRALAGALVRLGFRAGGVVVREGEQAGYVYLVARGELEVVQAGRVCAVLSPGEVFGDVALVWGLCWGATVVARTEATLYALDRETLARALEAGSSADAADSPTRCSFRP